MAELNLLDAFPSVQRKIEKGSRTEKNRIIARRYDKEFFDGDRSNGYGGFYYDGRWKKIVKKVQEVYGINNNSAVLDMGCAKGFFMFDLQDMLPGIKVAGMDISNYAINHAMDGYSGYLIKQGLETDNEAAKGLEELAKNKITPFMIEGSIERLPWPDKSFDAVFNINTLHNLNEGDCIKCISEMNRVCRNPEKMYIQVDSYRNKEERERMEIWALTANTVKSDKGWTEFFKSAGFKGDYFWTIV
ncbi:Ubiquinone/menaquinone biosynthesis C-methyltransferase UbiE [uncultured archaeon]|nr:Ubiquinone/menaquinone biosynthesis C-methyltransferase UbiE [uncultured archaeon]